MFQKMRVAKISDILRAQEEDNILKQTHLKIPFESREDPPGLALRSSGCSPDWFVGDGDGRSTFVGALTEGLAVRSGVVVGDICCWS